MSLQVKDISTPVSLALLLAPRAYFRAIASRRSRWPAHTKFINQLVLVEFTIAKQFAEERSSSHMK